MRNPICLIAVCMSLTSAASKPAGSAVNACPAAGDSNITALAIGEKYIWIGTRHGLYKVSRSTGKTGLFTSSNSKLPSDHISSLALEPDGNLWVGTGSGIMRYDNYSFYVLIPENSNIPDYNISSIAVDKEGNIWLGSADAGITVIRKNSKYHFRAQSSDLLNDSVSSLVARSNGSVLVKFANDSCRTLKLSSQGLLCEELSSMCLKNCFYGMQVAGERGNMLMNRSVSASNAGNSASGDINLKPLSCYKFPESHMGNDSLRALYFNEIISELSLYLAFRKEGIVMLDNNQ